MLKGTRVDGIYTADPEERTRQPRSSTISPRRSAEARSEKVMDPPPHVQNNIPIIVFDMDTVGNLKKSDARRRNQYWVHN